VVIPAYNEEKYIATCIESCLKDAPENLLEIIVVDNVCTDRTKEIAEKYPKVRVVPEPLKGLTKARQRGLLSMRGEVFLSIDADTRVPQGWFDKMLTELEKPGVACVTGPYRYYDLPPWKRGLLSIYWNFSVAVTYLLTGYMVVGGNFAVKKESLEKIGGFNTTIEFYGEDTDLARRLHEVGKIVYSMDLWIDTSGRRLSVEGMFYTPIIYAMNYIWIALFHRPFTKTHKDIR
jgi:glycosyltransferase involved in cell wall biosynthesis